MPSSKKYDEMYSETSNNSNGNSDFSISDNDYTEFNPRSHYENDWYDYNQEHILNLWEIIQRYIEENGLNLLEKATIISFTSFCAKESYRKEFEERILSKKYQLSKTRHLGRGSNLS